MPRQCTCGFSEFSERRTKTTTVVQRWIRYGAAVGGFGSGPIGEDLGGGDGGDGDTSWALVNVPLVSTESETRCRACSRVRLRRVLGGAGVYGAYRSGDGETLFVVVSDLTDVGCYAVHFRGPDTFVVQTKRAEGTPAVVAYGTPIEISESTPPSNTVEGLLSAAIPVGVRVSGTYAVVLVDRCSSTEYPLGTIFLEDESMMIPLNTAQMDVPPGLLYRPSNPDDAGNGFLRQPVADAIPFPKCKAVLEYDARLGSLPSGQGWSQFSVGSGQFSLFEGALVHHRTGGAADRWYKSLATDAVDDLLYGYAAVRTATTMRAALIAGHADAGDAATGLRFDLESQSRGAQRVLHYDLNGGSVIASNANDLPHGWLRVGYGADGDVKYGALEDRILAWSADSEEYTDSLVPTTARRVEGTFGLTSEDYSDYAWYRYVCVSLGGLFHRPYFRGVSQVQTPVLRLYFFVETYTGPDTARFTVRYGSGLLDPRTRPATALSTTLSITAAGAVQEIALALTDIGPGPIWFSIERDWSHADDTFGSPVHLSQITVRSA